MPHGDAVGPGANNRFVDGHARVTLQVNAVRVGAVGGRGDLDVGPLEVLAG